MATNAGTMTLTVKVDVKMSWQTAVKMRLMGRLPSAIIAKAIADRIKNGN